MPRGNPNPKQTKEFLAHVPSTPADLPGGVEMASQPIGCKYPVEIDRVLRSLPNRSERIRVWVMEGMKRDELL